MFSLCPAEGMPPLGWKVGEAGELVPLPEQQVVVRRMRKLKYHAETSRHVDVGAHKAVASRNANGPPDRLMCRSLIRRKAVQPSPLASSLARSYCACVCKEPPIGHGGSANSGERVGPVSFGHAPDGQCDRGRGVPQTHATEKSTGCFRSMPNNFPKSRCTLGMYP
jgi:hypothetical protein